MVEREAPAPADQPLISLTPGSSLSDPALPGCVSLRERKVSLDLMQASVPDGPGWSRLALRATARGGPQARP